MKYVLGTDAFGRDILSRLIYGARVSLIVALLALTAGGGVGLLIGIVAGYFGGTVDNVLMRLVDAAFTFPAILFALLLAVTMGQGLTTLVIAISLLLWASFARIIRGEVLSLEAARLRGAGEGARLFLPANHAHTHPAERVEHIHGAGHIEYRCRDHRRGVVEFPRRRYSAADANLGTDGLRGTGTDRRCLVGVAHSGYRDHAAGAVRQSVRRLVARPARPEIAAV